MTNSFNTSNTFNYIVPQENSGLRLVSFLHQQLGCVYSVKALKRAIEQNHCQLNGRTERFSSASVGRGDVISIHLQSVSNNKVTIEPTILFEDENLLVCNKPAGMTCDSAGILKFFKDSIPSLQLVHRLDRETTGLLLLAKRDEIYNNLVEQFKKFEVKKRYIAIVDRVVNRPKGVIENFLGKIGSYAGQTIWGQVNYKGLSAVTEWTLLSRGSSESLLMCFPKTGRTHQIRVHLAGMGHPILGDFQYGKDFNSCYQTSRYFLHADELRFFDPKTKRPLCFKAPLPDDFREAQKHLFGIA